MDVGMDTDVILKTRQSIEDAIGDVNELKNSMAGIGGNSPQINSPNVPKPIEIPVELKRNDAELPKPLVEPIEIPVEWVKGDTNLPEPPIEPIKIPVEWVTDDIQVFNNTGADRFRQECESANQMLTTLSTTQNQIAQNAANTDVFSASAIQDINGISQRIQLVQQRIQQIENNPMNIGSDRANAELEGLRMQLNSSIQLQNRLNQAVQNMDVEEANAAYNQLSRTIGNTERYIRDNVDEQGRFTNEIRESSSAADGLTNKIMGMVGAYASLQGLQKLVNLSDKATQTTARLSMIVDDGGSVEELEDKIMASAKRSRASYLETADTVAKLSLNAGDAFGSNNETILFAENLNKLFAIAGTEQASMSSATLQLTQALGSGVLRGEEFNAVFEAAPNIMQKVADYMDVPIGKLRGIAADGEITASIVKNALIGASEDINTQFESMPMTWSQVWTGVMNNLYEASKPILSVISWMAQNWSILEPIVVGLATAVGLYTAALLINKGVQVASTIAKTMSAIAAVAHGTATAGEMAATVGMTQAQLAFNAALYASPLTWILLIIIAIIAVIFAVIAVINKVTKSSISAIGVITGALAAAGAFVWNLFLGVLDIVLAVVNWMYNKWAAFANFFANVFNDPIGSIIRLFGDLADNVLGILENIAKAIDKVFGSNLAGAVQGWRSGLGGMVEDFANKHGSGKYEKVVEELNLSSESLGLSRWAYGDAYNTGYDWGANIGGSDAGTFEDLLGDVNSSNLAETAENTGKTAKALDITNEDLKYLRDIAETEVINRFTTAEIKVDMTNNNNISKDMDLDGVVEYLVIGVNEAMEKAAEGVHS